ncbi:hypothetical protein [Nocardia amamiensis]|uniref:hypothetical protein n=1 Tax=Nocardia amamiensis TaxID=404578 RepID=UPI0008373829|nr:hypothetical protein [Nocardia amamiensis]
MTHEATPNSTNPAAPDLLAHWVVKTARSKEMIAWYLLERLRSGDDPSTLLEQGAGTRPGTTSRSNKSAVTWKTL